MTGLTEAEKALLDDKCPSGEDTDGWEFALLHRTVAAIIDARLAPIRALADIEDCDHPSYYRDSHTKELVARYPGGWCEVCGEWREALLAALSAHESAPQSHDGTGSQPDGERAVESGPCPDQRFAGRHYAVGVSPTTARQLAVCHGCGTPFRLDEEGHR